ncbi:MAG: hypothetical protein LBE02_04100 [Spirochaetaceae bacterium]|jgi:hypothetical protein|nr:hypothetical protein [Spirochaetaceae bacterium]
MRRRPNGLAGKPALILWKKPLLCPLLFLMLAVSGSGQPLALTNLAGPEYAELLRKNEKLIRIQYKNISPALIPSDPYLKNMTAGLMRDLGPTLFVETLQLYRKAPSRNGGPWSPAERAGLYNQTLALSTLTGLQYYSARRKSMRTFYESSTVVSGPDGNTPRPDPSYTSPPAELTIYARQKDLSFGDNVYRYDYYVRPDALIFVQENLTAMNYGIIPAVGKNRLRSLVAVYDAGDFLLIYAASMARTASVPGMNERVGASFTNRIEAFLGWFTKQADKVFK